MRFARLMFVCVLIASTASPAWARARGEPGERALAMCFYLPPLFSVFTQQHYAVKRVDQAIERRTAERFIEILDPSKSLLLMSDVEKLRVELPGLFTTARRGDCKLLDAAWTLLERRAAEDRRIAAALLTPDFAIDDRTELILDPRQRAYAENEQERAARVRGMIHFQMSSYLASGLAMDKAKRQLLHRYELIDKRLADRRKKGLLPGLFAQAYAEALDPHSAYMSPDELADFEIALKLSLEGIGAVLTTDDGFVVIQSLVPGGQAEKTGQLRPNDKVIAVAQEGEAPVSVIDMELGDVVKMIRGKKGTKVTLTVLREGKATTTFPVTIVRDKIDVSSQAAKISYQKRKIAGRELTIGVIDLPSFYGGERGGRSSFGDMKRLLAEAREKKADGLVLDLSRNGGGLLNEAVSISGLFLRRGAIVGTRSSDGRFEVLDDTDPSVDWPGPLAIVVSRASASASEILAGSLRDYERALLIGGAKTFGKGTVQVVVPMSQDIGAIRVTTGMFFLPGGRSTQLVGVPADLAVPSLFDGLDASEDKLEYALPAQSVPAFLSPEANASGAWRKVPAALPAALATKSRERIARSAEFKKIREQLEDTAKNKGVVMLGDLRKRAAKERPPSGDEDAPKDPEQEAVLGEAVNILVDAIEAGLGRR